MVVGGEATSAGRPINNGAVRPRLPRRGASKSPIAQTTLASGRQWCGSKGAYNRPSYPCHYCTYRDVLLRQGAVDKAKADDQRHAGERQHHHLKVRKAVVGKQRKIVHAPPKDIPVISRSEPAEGSWWRLVYLNKRFRSASTSRPAVLDEFAINAELEAQLAAACAQRDAAGRPPCRPPSSCGSTCVFAWDLA